MLGRPKKEDSREKQYRVRLNDKEDEMLAFASNATGVPKSEIFRKALQEYCEKVKLHVYPEVLRAGNRHIRHQELNPGPGTGFPALQY